MSADCYVVSADAKKEDGRRRKATREKGPVCRRAAESLKVLLREDPRACLVGDAVKIGDEGTRALEGVEIAADIPTGELSSQ